MPVIRFTYRCLLLITVISAGCLLTVVFQRSYRSGSGNNFGKTVTCWWHRRVANVMGISVRTFGKPANEATLFIANHVSWFDINAFGGTIPVRFLAKIEVKQTPVLGWLASKAGTLYIHRGRKTSASNAIDIMADALTQNHHVVLFAEGTTQGEVNRFHSRLVQSAINAGCCIQPVAIRYPSLDGEYVHPAALFTDGITMGQSMLNIMTAKNLVAELHFLDPVETDGKKRDELASHAEDQVRALIENVTNAK